MTYIQLCFLKCFCHHISKRSCSCRPTKTQPKWRHYHWDFIKQHEAPFRVSLPQFVLLSCQVDLDKARKRQIGYGTSLGLSDRCEQALTIYNIQNVCIHTHVILKPCQALALLSVQNTKWVMADVSQNLGRMPTLSSFNQPFPCVTPCAQLCKRCTPIVRQGLTAYQFLGQRVAIGSGTPSERFQAPFIPTKAV